jgi:hypothetical protein
MAKAKQPQQYKTNISKVYTGLHNDNNPIDQPKGTHRFALNAVNEAQDGQQANLSNERGTVISGQLPEGYFFLGDRYLEDNLSAVIIKNPTTNRDQIGFVNKDGVYTVVVDTAVLGLSMAHQCDIRYRLRRGKERVIYWVDGFHKARSFNFDRQYEYYTTLFQDYIRGGGDPNTYVGEKWQGSAFDLIKTAKSVPFFTDVDVIEVGSIVPGSYNFAVQYVDSDLNPTEWITTSNTVNIYNDAVDTTYYKIRGSRNADNSYQSFEPANKSIRLTLTNMDTDFPYFRIAIICATGVTGQPVEVFASDIQSTTNGIFIYSGNNGSLTKTSLEDILIQNEVLFAPNHIEQIENRLTLADTKGKGIDWCQFQKFASKIAANLTTKDVILNSVLSEPNIKNAKSTFLYRGYMPGEVYSFGIVYLFSDGTLSPAFHIPGVSTTNTTSSMVPYEVSGALYEDIHNCSTQGYWGKDSDGDTLVGSPYRHHRFPFRKDVGIPLFTRLGDTAIIVRYRLTFTLSLVGGQTWPTNPDTTDKVITYKIIYKVGSTGSNVTLTRTIIKSQLGTSIILYDEVDALGDVSGTVGTMPIAGTIQEVLVTEAGTLSDYITSGVFTVAGTYTQYDAESVYNVDRSQIYGINFSDIEKPNEDVIGFYIVRNERKEDDKIIIDNALFGPMIENEQYKAFGLVMPKQYYPVQTPTGFPFGGGCVNITRNSGKTLVYSKRSCWFFNPEYQFFAKKTNFNSINIQGTFTETGINLPTRKEEYNGVCVNYRGILIQDVQPGTSFNPDVNKGSDSDGFDMIIGYRNTEINYQDLTYILPHIERTFYLNAATYQNYNSDVLYNVSCDNKIGIMYFSSDLDTEKFYSTTNKRNFLLYGSMVRDNLTSYSNFMNRTYYKEHNNPFLFGGASTINNISVFNGDAYIQPLTLNSTVFYDTLVADRTKKSRVWQVVVGAVLVVAGIVAAVLTAGASLPLSAAAISYGMSLAVAGFKFEQFKNMLDNDYSKGLKDCVTDGAVYECIGDDMARGDDTIRWFGDRVNALYIESSVPFGLRDGLTAGVVDFVDSPSQFEEDVYRGYLTEKLTTIDRDQGSGRLYKGYATAEFYSMNPDYMRFNKETVFTHLALEYDCCADAQETFSDRVWWSEQSFQEEKIDNYRVFLPNNYKDIEGEHGAITGLFRMGNALFVHTKEAVWQLPQNIQERVTSEVVSFIGTGEFFNIPPRKILDDNLGSGGTQHKWASIKSDYGYIFISEIENKVYILSEKIKEISNEGVRNWFKNNLKSYLSHQFFTNLGIPYPNDNNPANPAGIGYLATFDTRHNRYIVTKRDYLYLGDFSKIIVDFDPSEDYPIGDIIITDNGFEEIIDIDFSASVPITTGDWVKDDIGNTTPSLGVPTSPTDPLVLTYGVVYYQNGMLIYEANSFEDIDFDGNDHVTDTINVYLNACAQEQIQVTIPNIPSKRCPNFFGSGGSTLYTETKIVLGIKPGVVKFLLSTFTIADGFHIYYGEPSSNILLWSTCDLPGAGSPPDCLVATQPIEGDPGYEVCSTDPDEDTGDPYEIAIFFNYPATNPNIQHVTLVTQAPSFLTRWGYSMGCPCQGGLPTDPEDLTDWNYCADCSS